MSQKYYMHDINKDVIVILFQEMFLELCRKDNVILQSLYERQQSLVLRVKVEIDQFKTDIYETRLNDLKDGEGLEKNFDNLEDLNEFLKDSSHFDLDLVELTLTIVMKTEVNKKVKKCQMGKMCLEHIQAFETRPNRVLIDQILTKCRKKEDFTHKDTKQMIKNVAMVLENLSNQNLNLIDFKKQYQQQMRIFESDAIKSMKNNKDPDNQIVNIYATMDQTDSSIKTPQAQKNQVQSLLKNLQQTTLHKQQFQSFKKIIISELNAKFDGYDMELDQIKKFLLMLKNGQINTINQGVNRRFAEMELKMKENLQNFTKIQHDKLQKLEKTGFFKEETNSSCIRASEWIDWQSIHSKNIQFENSHIISKGWSNILGKPRLSKLFAYTVSIKKITGFISLGVIDSSYKNTQSMGPNQIVYFNDGLCRVLDKKSQKTTTLKQGQIIRVILDRSLGTIEWMTGLKQIYKLQEDKIKDPNINWVPYIYIGSGDDCVEIIQ